MKSKEIVLVCDIDDVLVNSSALLQEQVDKKTIYTIEKLRFCEQLVRNCRYFADLVKKECDLARSEKRLPNLSRFPGLEYLYSGVGKIGFEYLRDEYIYDIYSRPVIICGAYVSLALRIYNQFLEHRDMFLEGDNLLKGQSIDYDYKREAIHIEGFRSAVRSSFGTLRLINHFCLLEAQRISAESRMTGSRPNYGLLVSPDANDVIKTNIGGQKNQEYYWYVKPIEDIERCIATEDIMLHDIVECYDIVRTPSRELIDYEGINQPENVNFDAVNAIRKLLSEGRVQLLFQLTHHNGYREETAKRRLMKYLFPGSVFVGMRFHSEEHNANRRGRSSKFDKMSQMISFSDRIVILLDDSRDNCRDWHEKGGDVILYRPVNDAERSSSIEDIGYPRITSFSQLESAIDKIEAKHQAKVKKLK